jgi:hypothetical protein
LRAGLATSAAEAGQQESDIMQQTRHKSEKMVRRYIRKGSPFQGNVVDALGVLRETSPRTGVCTFVRGHGGSRAWPQSELRMDRQG